jgi:DNA polymerase V
MMPVRIVKLYAVAARSDATVPLYGSAPAAGFPAPGDDMVEASLNIHDLLVHHPEATYFVRVQGNSMEGAGIFSDDVLVVDRSIEPRHGMIVVAAVGGGMVVKRLRVEGGQLFLVSEQTGYEPIAVTEENECFLFGVVTGSVRQF